MSRRPVARLVVCLAILILGAVSAWRLELSYLPSRSFPELYLSLSLRDVSEVDEMTRLYVQPLESAVRAMGDVTSAVGEVYTSGGRFRVRFKPGTDAERKAARLESELTALRRALPAGSRLGVWPAGQGGGDMSMFLWVGQEGGSVGRSFVEAVRALPEVRAVEVAGEDLRELRVTAGSRVDPSVLRAAFEDHLAVHRLGETTDRSRRLPVYLRSPSPRGTRRSASFDTLPLRHGEKLLPFRALAEIRLADEDAPMIVHRRGQRGLVLVISREYEASPLRLELSLRRTLERFGLAGRSELIRSEAEPLSYLLKSLGRGFLAALAATVLLAGALGGLRVAAAHALALPVALAAALVAFSLAGLTLDVTTLPMLAVALGWCLFLPALRLGGGGRGAAATLVGAAALLPVAVALAGGRIAPLFQDSTRAFLWAQLAGTVAFLIVPLPAARDRLLGLSAGGRLSLSAVGRPWRAALRRPWTVLLGTVTLTSALFVVFGSALEPRPGPLSPVTADLRVELRFAEGTTPRQAEAQVTLAERELSNRREVLEHWSFFTDRWAVIDAGVRPEDRSPEELRRLSARLQLILNALGSSSRVTPLATGASRGDEPVRFTDSLEDRAETDPAARSYRFILRSTDLEKLRTVHAQMKDRVSSLPRIGEGQIRSDWGRPDIRLELSPRPGAAPEAVAAASRILRRRGALAPVRELPSTAEVDLRVLGPEDPRTRDEVRQGRDLLGLQVSPPAPQGAPQVGHDVAVVVPGALFETREVLASPGVKRQAGRYVLPVTVTFQGLQKRFEDRETVHRFLRFYPLPAGCDIELPELRTDYFSPERRRMLAIAATLPLLLWAFAAIRLDSVWRALAALSPLLVGLAAATPWIRAAKGHVDEMILFALAATAVGGLPLAVHTVAASTGAGTTSGSRGRDYRWLVSHGPAFLVATAGLVVLLAVPAAGVDADRHPWAMPLRLAGVAGAFSCLGSVLCLPGLLRAAAHWRRRKVRRARRRATLEAWRRPGSLDLETRRLAKVYGNGFQALRGVDFRLEPGIVGLLGPNGAGKTTLLRTLCGLLEPSRGRVLYRGVAITPDNLPEYRRLVGFLPQDFNAYPGFTGARFLDYWALEKGLRDPRERSREVERRLAEVGLEDAAGRKVREYSGGMRRRIGIARALLGEPPIVIVDEPTTGLDVASRNRLRESLLSVAGDRIILFSTHIASDVAAAAARVLVLNEGRLLYDGSSKSLVERAHGMVFETLIDDAELREFSHRHRVTTRVRTLDGIRVRAVASDGEAPPGQVVEPNLEEAYLAVIGGQGWKRERSRTAGSLLDLESWRQMA